MLAGGAVASGEVIERIVAVINDSILLQSELEERIAPMRGQLDRIPDPTMRAQRLDELRRQMLDRMIDDKLIAQQADKLKLTVGEKDLERAIQDVMRKNNLTLDGLKEALAQEGQSLEAYKQMVLRPQLLRLRVLNTAVRSRVSVTDEEIPALYQQNLRELGVQTKVRARHIFVALPRTRTRPPPRRRGPRRRGCTSWPRPRARTSRPSPGPTPRTR